MSPTEAPMNLSLPHRQRVHWQRAGFPACGGGRHGKHGLWQMEISEVTCRRCLKLAKAHAEKTAEAKPA